MNDQEVLKAIKKYGSARKAAKALNLPKSTFGDWAKRARSHKLTEKKVIRPVVLKGPKKASTVKRYILSAAQDSTKIHPFLDVLKVYADYLGAEILISGYTYNKSLFEDHSKHVATFAPEIQSYLTNDRIILGDKVCFAGELNILPTAIDPLSGLTTYTENRHGIIPHSKVRLTSVPNMKNDPAKILMTTGTVTRPNYIQKLAGSKAEFHHTYAAVLVELCSNGEFFCRHLMGEDKDGSFYDLDKRVTIEGVTEGHRIEALNAGDIHLERANELSFVSTLGYSPEQKKIVSNNSLIDKLKPKHFFYHDLVDFKFRNSHSVNDPHFKFKQFITGEESIESTFQYASQFLHDTKRDFCTSVVVESNHDRQLARWLGTADYRQDPVNAIFFLENQLAQYTAIKDRNKSFNIFWEALKKYSPDNCKDIVFVPEDTSYKVLDVECGMHGHLGANGAKPSPLSFSKMGTKANIGHSHSASIIDGIWTAGVSGELDMDYNKGLSSWSVSHIVTYMNGKRAMLTMSDSGKFYAE